MCLSPIRIRNPNYNPISQRNKLIRTTSDCESLYINVPCNNCSVCISLRQNYFVQRVKMEALDNVIFFVTLTYSQDYVPKMFIEGVEYLIHDIRDVQNLWKRVRKNYDLPKFRYFVTSEYGSRTHRPHYHLLLFFPFSHFNLLGGKPIISEVLAFERKLSDILLNEWCINIGSTRNPEYVPLCHYSINGRFRNFDCQFVDTIFQDCSNVSFYVSKYVCKYDKYVDSILKQFRYMFDDEQYQIYKSWFRPRMLYSKGFGNILSDKVKDYIHRCIDYSLKARSPYPCFYDELTGSSFPLSPYFRKHFVDCDTSLKFLDNSYDDSLSEFSRVIETDNDIVDSIKKSIKFYKNMDYLNHNINDIDYLTD